MTKVTDLVSRWALYAEWTDRGWDASSMNVQFRHADGRRRNPLEFASVDEARAVFREVKRQLDILDKTSGIPWVEWKRAALERGKLALEVSLKLVERWTSDLLDTGVRAA